MKDSDNEDFTTDFNQTHKPSTYHLLTDHITEVYESNKQIRDLIHTLNTDVFKFKHFNLNNLHVNQDQVYINELKQFFISDYENLHTQIIDFCYFNQIHNYKGEWVTFYQLN